MAKIFALPDGRNVTVEPDGSIREITPEELGRSKPKGLTQEQGVSFGQRATFKNVASNPKARRGYLEREGYEVRNWGSGANDWAVRLPGGAWKVVDPKGVEPQDLMDFAFDAATAFAIPAGAVAGGGVASAATVAGVVGGLEAGRQALGSFLGVPDNFEPLQIGAAALAGAAVPAAGWILRGTARSFARGILKAGPTGKKIFTGLTSRLTRTKSTAGLDGPEAFLQRLTKYADKTELASTEDAARVLVDAVETTSERQFAESVKLRSLMSFEEAQGRTVNFSSVADMLSDLTRPTKAGIRITATEKTAGEARKKAAAIFDSADEMIRESLFMRGMSPNFEWRAVPATVADEFRQWFGKKVRVLGGFKGLPEDTALATELSKIGGRVVGSIDDHMARATDPRVLAAYTRLKSGLQRKTASLNKFRDAFEGNVEKAESYVASIYGTGKGAARRTLEDFDELFGTQTAELVREAQVGAQVGRQGVFAVTPELTATGQFVSPGTLGIGGAGAGAIIGGVQGAIFGGALGLGTSVLGSPKVIGKISRSILRPGGLGDRLRAGMFEASRQIPSVTGPRTTIRRSAVVSLQNLMKQAGGSSPARQDKHTRRRTILLER